jgi:hypothetical protein
MHGKEKKSKRLEKWKTLEQRHSSQLVRWMVRPVHLRGANIGTRQAHKEQGRPAQASLFK